MITGHAVNDTSDEKQTKRIVHNNPKTSKNLYETVKTYYAKH